MLVSLHCAWLAKRARRGTDEPGRPWLKHRSRDSIVSPRAQNHHRPLCGSSMAKYAQNTTCGHTCPWGTGDDNLPPDSFTQAAQKAAAKRREVQEKDIREVEVEPEDGAWSPSQLRPTSARSAAARSNAHPSARSTASQKAKKVETEMESKVMDLINQCLDKKVLELRQLTTTSPPNDGAASSVVKTARSSATGFTTERSVKSCGTEQSALPEADDVHVTMANKRAQIKKLSDASLGQFDADQSREAYLEMQKSAAAARNKNRSALTFDYAPSARSAKAAPKVAPKAAPKKAKAAEEKKGYEALERYPALLKEIQDLSASKHDAPQGLTSNGKQKQAMKLSDASLGKFDNNESRLAFLEMQKSAQEARNKNRSNLCFGEEVSSPKGAGGKDVTMAGKRASAQKLSDASLGMFDADQSQMAYLDMQNTAAEMRNKNRVGQGIF
ncbi:unnamed protein product [Durusdinium trenchii]|uniref:Small acidic protein-like domain-containing protein n=1 Tax=Durusdinium trenchii TaxID=1381693 RepID=A0ABP0PF01_9DINO